MCMKLQFSVQTWQTRALAANAPGGLDRDCSRAASAAGFDVYLCGLLSWAIVAESDDTGMKVIMSLQNRLFEKSAGYC